MAASTNPRTRRTANNTQHTYNLSRRINDVQTYPYLSPQGATILIYSHDSGITIQWRGGRRLKPQSKAKPASSSKQNGATQDSAAMIIDSDDDEPAKSEPAKFIDKPVFEDEAEDEASKEVVQTLDLTFGTAVRKVAVMPLPAEVGEDATKKKAPVLQQNMVFAVSCVTNDAYLVTTPLTPPSNEAKQRPQLKENLLAGKAGSGAWGETLVLLKGQMKMSDGIAINLVLPGQHERSPKSARVVVASHSREASGVLNLWDVPLDAKTKSSSLEPFQSEFLPKPLTSISFNPTHSTQLLTVSPTHGVRIYNFAVPSLPPDPEATGPFPAQGSWLLTLYQPFVRPSSMRKPIVDAAWISHGHAVFALLADGMWGIWDIDGAGPGKTGPSMSTKLRMGVRGAALTAFSVSGFVEGTSSLRSVVAPSRDSQSGEFAPMTPHTRKAASVAMSAASTADRLATIHGGIKVASLPSMGGKAIPDESLALWLGSYDHVCVIPLVSKFWDAQLRKPSAGGAGLFSGAQPTKMVKLQELSTGLLGERCCGVDLLVDPSRAASSQDNTDLPVEVLIRGETRLVIVQSSSPTKPSTVLTTRRRLFSDRHASDAIIVHGGKSHTASANFNLSTVRTGSLRVKQPLQIENGPETTPKPRSGFAFMDDLDAAADVTGNDDSRDVDAEMLDIMGIDQALASMDGEGQAHGRNGRKKVVFEED